MMLSRKIAVSFLSSPFSKCNNFRLSLQKNHPEAMSLSQALLRIWLPGANGFLLSSTLRYLISSLIFDNWRQDKVCNEEKL